MRYHLCCGKKHLSGWVNVDREKFGQEVVADINREWKFIPHGSADHILIEDGLEHVHSLEDFFHNASASLAEKGILEIRVPHFKNPSAYRVTHKHFFSYSFFRIFPEAHDATQDLIPYKIELIVHNKFPLSLLNILANCIPNLWERIAYVSGLHVWMRKEGK